MAAYVPVRGIPHFYQWFRSDEMQAGSTRLTPKRPVLVFLHGWGGSARYWEATAQVLARDFDCLLYDLRGFGRSRSTTTRLDVGYSLRDYAEDLLALLNEFQLERIYLAAHSFGASVATVFAGEYPERVERLLLTCSGVFPYNPLTFKLFHWASAQVVRFRFNWMRQVPYAEHLFMSRFLYRPLSSAVSQMFLEDYLMADAQTAIETVYEAVSEKAAIEMPRYFAQLQTPTLLIAGEADQIIPPTMARAAACLNPCVDYFEIPATGHFPMLEAPEKYFVPVQNFLAAG